MKRFRDILIKLVNIVSILLIVFSLGVLLTVVMTGKNEVPSLFGYSMFRVVTGSMEPTIPVNSLIVVKDTELGELAEGDVISFYSRDPSLLGQVNTHRIVTIETANGKYSLKTKGDANNVTDKYTVEGEDVIGKVVYHSLILGKIISILSNPIVFLPLIVLPLTVLVLINLIKSVKLAKQLARDEEEQAVREAIEDIRQRKMQEAEALLKEAEAIREQNNTEKEEVPNGWRNQD